VLSLQPDFGFRWRVSQAVPGPNTYRGSDAGARLPPVSSQLFTATPGKRLQTLSGVFNASGSNHEDLSS